MKRSARIGETKKFSEKAVRTGIRAKDSAYSVFLAFQEMQMLFNIHIIHDMKHPFRERSSASI
jgi:hypothetical protein